MEITCLYFTLSYIALLRLNAATTAHIIKLVTALAL